MKKLISLRTQYIMLYLPFVNACILFVWLLNYHHSGKNFAIFARSLLILLGVGSLLAVIYLVLSKLLVGSAVMLAVLHILALYAIPFAIGLSLIHYQKKVLTF